MSEHLNGEGQVVPKIQDFDKLQMWTSTPGVEGKRSKLSFGIRDGNPRVTIFTNDPKDTIQKGIISAPMNPETFFIFLKKFEDVIKHSGEIKYKIDCYTSRWENNQRTNDRILLSELYFGKDAEGILWISVVAANRPKIKFSFRMSDYHGIYNSEGIQITEADASILEACAKLAILRGVYTALITKSIENPIARTANAANNFNTNSKPQKPTPSESEFSDLPF